MRVCGPVCCATSMLSIPSVLSRAVAVLFWVVFLICTVLYRTGTKTEVPAVRHPLIF